MAGHGETMDLYSFADGDPVNQFDPDGRFVAGMGNGLGSWASDTYAMAGNLLDAVMRPFFAEKYGLDHFPGGHEPDANYAKNFANGSAAYQWGHVAGYFGAEVGFQLGLVGAAKGMGMLARAAIARNAGVAVEALAPVAAEGGLAGAEMARIGTSAEQMGIGLSRVQGGLSMARVARAEAFASRSWVPTPGGFGPPTSPWMPRPMNAGAGPLAGGMGNLESARYSALKFDGPESREAFRLVRERNSGIGLGFIQGGKVKLFRVKPSQNEGHPGIIKSGLITPTPSLRGFSLFKYRGQVRILKFSEMNPPGRPNLSNYHIRELKKLLGLTDVW